MNKKTWVAGLTFALFVSGVGQADAHELTYKVQAGDSLWKIATANHLSVTDLKAWNGLTSDQIYVGQTLTLLPPHTHDTTYIVKAGDSLSTIAKTYNVFIADIKIRNQLSNDFIYPGQTLIISAEKGTYTTHTVRAGETLSIIARDYGISLVDLKTWNQLSTDTIYVGQVLSVAKPAETPTTSPTETKAVTYTVQAGDSLYSIANKYGATVQQLKTINNLTSDTIYVGQVLKITDGEVSKPVAPDRLQDSVFPLQVGTYTPFGDTYGESRQYGGQRVHEGIDIIAPKGTPIYSSTDGTVVRKGWSDLGGWRLTVKTSEGVYIYYAHMQTYATGINEGGLVKKGQLIGYVGDSGYGPLGTTGKFVAHLHFGMYDLNWNAINPYNYLKYWEWKMNNPQ
ncbi:LysM peptidoglycan-binding domain-containing protein [Anoxybacteroides amylolyticum]|uniref:Spore coat assembly SafA n=1 Tax=Anoxybacteroides amylolyticum TaxID=294699 RepID=A0A160F5R5_9BACL|nr:LysM peptidoglycan-binding domain-containing protein [Anoxybacillus amylolyticus]ANB61215.1 spore coat assembly SafA [Anoxybacillus amylolyticus]